MNNAMQSNEPKDNRYFIGDFVFQNKQIFHVMHFIEKTLKPLYEEPEKLFPPFTKNMKFRNNRISYLAILKILNFYVDRLEVMRYKLDNKIWVMCDDEFAVSFPNIQYLFYERFILAETIPSLEEDSLKNN